MGILCSCFIGFSEENSNREMRQSLGVSARPTTSSASSPSLAWFPPSHPASQPQLWEAGKLCSTGLRSFTLQAASKQSLPFVLKCCVGALVTHLSLHSARSQNLGMDVDELSMWELAGLSEHLPLWNLTQRVPLLCPKVCVVGKFILHCHWQCFYFPNTFQTDW